MVHPLESITAHERKNMTIAPLGLLSLGASSSSPELVAQYKKLLWCHPSSEYQCLREHYGQEGLIEIVGETGQTARERMLKGHFCEEVLSTAVCAEQWYGYLAVTDEREWHVEISHCPMYTETMYGAVRNELRILASTNVRSVDEHHLGAVVLKFENTTASYFSNWGRMASEVRRRTQVTSRRRRCLLSILRARVCVAAQQDCSMLCLRQDARRNVYMVVISIKCPSWEPRGANMPDLGMCGHDAPSMALLPAGQQVTALESAREGEVCDWRPVGVSPPPPSMWSRASGAASQAAPYAAPLLTCALVGGKSALLALALRRLLPTPALAAGEMVGRTN